MEKGIDAYIREQFELADVDIRTYSPLTLAYIGDCIFADIYRRGRNAKSYTMAKNATMADYRKATGLEAVIGYLYLTDQFARAVELTKNAIDGLKLSV